jgi:acyl transferase domain-containing protein
MPGSVAARQGMAFFSAGSASELVARLGRGQKGTDGGFARAAVLDPTPERIARAVAIAERGRPWRGRDGIWFSPLGLLSSGGKVAFLFPGVDVSFEPRVDDVARHFSLPVPPCTTPQNLQEVAIGIIGVNRMFDRVLRAIGVEPSDIAGHSIGEWSGMIATGIVPDEAADRLIASLGPGSMNVPGVVFATAGCGVERVMGALEGLDEIALSHDNCPHQVLVCGIDASVERAIERLRQDGVVCQKLPFQSGFHSPLFADYIGPHRENFARLPIASPRSTLWSATTCAPYPEDPEAIRELAILHLVHPVRFRELVELLHAEGTRVFLQAGAGSLVHFVEDTLRGRPHLAVAANVKERPGMDQLARVAAALFVEGAKLDLDRVLPREVAPARGENHPLVVEFTESMTAIAEAERDVMARFAALTDRTPRETTTICKLSIETLPELLDHTFVRQPVGWPTLSDRQPVVPMTIALGGFPSRSSRSAPTVGSSSLHRSTPRFPVTAKMAIVSASSSTTIAKAPWSSRRDTRRLRRPTRWCWPVELSCRCLRGLSMRSDGFFTGRPFKELSTSVGSAKGASAEHSRPAARGARCSTTLANSSATG